MPSDLVCVRIADRVGLCLQGLLCHYMNPGNKFKISLIMHEKCKTGFGVFSSLKNMTDLHGDDVLHAGRQLFLQFAKFQSSLFFQRRVSN